MRTSRRSTFRPILVIVVTTLLIVLVACGGGKNNPPPQPAATVTGDPTTITVGQPSSLTWSCTNAATCVGSGFSTGGQMSGTVSTSPSQTTTYGLTAFGPGGSAQASATVTVTAAAPLQVTQSSLPQGVVGASYSTTLGATGGIEPYAWNLASGSLAPGLSLNRAGAVSGTPGAAGDFNFVVAVADSEQPPSVAIGTFSLHINPPLQVTTTALPNGIPSVAYGATLAAVGGLSPYSWAITQGALPSGLTLTATSGLISGTPTTAGTSSFTVQVSDSEIPAATATTSLSIVVNPAPPRSAALYTAVGVYISNPGQFGLKIQSDGSLTLLPSSPEPAIQGSYFAPSPTLPLLFMLVQSGSGQSFSGTLNSLLVNPDYSLTWHSSSAPLPGAAAPPSVDPTGANLYLPGSTDSSGGEGVTIFRGDGSFQLIGTVTTTDPPAGRMVFTPDATLAFLSTCSQNGQNSILSFSRSSNGMLTPAATYSTVGCVGGGMAVSPDGRYLATSEMQIYSIASDGTLAAILLQPVTITVNGVNYGVAGLTWDSSGSYLIASTYGPGFPIAPGGVAVLSFSGSALTETVPPTGGFAVGRLQQTGSFVYAVGPFCASHCRSSILGFDFQNGQLIPLPGSPYPYGNEGDMVIY